MVRAEALSVSPMNQSAIKVLALLAHAPLPVIVEGRQAVRIVRGIVHLQIDPADVVHVAIRVGVVSTALRIKISGTVETRGGGVHAGVVPSADDGARKLSSAARCDRWRISGIAVNRALSPILTNHPDPARNLIDPCLANGAIGRAGERPGDLRVHVSIMAPARIRRPIQLTCRRRLVAVIQSVAPFRLIHRVAADLEVVIWILPPRESVRRASENRVAKLLVALRGVAGSTR